MRVRVQQQNNLIKNNYLKKKLKAKLLVAIVFKIRLTCHKKGRLVIKLGRPFIEIRFIGVPSFITSAVLLKTKGF